MELPKLDKLEAIEAKKPPPPPLELEEVVWLGSIGAMGMKPNPMKIGRKYIETETQLRKEMIFV
jgi:hypothetical protein